MIKHAEILDAIKQEAMQDELQKIAMGSVRMQQMKAPFMAAGRAVKGAAGKTREMATKILNSSTAQALKNQASEVGVRGLSAIKSVGGAAGQGTRAAFGKPFAGAKAMGHLKNVGTQVKNIATNKLVMGTGGVGAVGAGGYMAGRKSK